MDSGIHHFSTCHMYKAAGFKQNLRGYLSSQDNVIGDITFPICHNDNCQMFNRMKFFYCDI